MLMFRSLAMWDVSTRVLQTPPNRLSFPTALLTATCTWEGLPTALEPSVADLPSSCGFQAAHFEGEQIRLHVCLESAKKLQQGIGIQPGIDASRLKLSPTESHCWWFINPKQPPWDVKSLANNGINYQPQLVGRISSINSMTSTKKCWFLACALCFSASSTCWSASRWCTSREVLKSSMIQHRLRIFPFPIGPREIYMYVYIYIYINIYIYICLDIHPSLTDLKDNKPPTFPSLKERFPENCETSDHLNQSASHGRKVLKKKCRHTPED